MKLIVGLGNIGRQYAATRHNIGFMVADTLAGRWKLADKWRKSEHAYYVEYVRQEKVYLIKPTTYMNLSGLAVAEFAHYYHIEAENILVLQDDLDLPCGKIRVRRKGSSGGHNGLRSIAECIGSTDFPRLKIGIGHPSKDGDPVVSHVLQQFSTFEQEKIAQSVERAADAVELWVQNSDISAVMALYNGKTPEEIAQHEAKRAATAALRNKEE